MGNQSLARGLEVLTILVDEHRPMSPTEIAQRIGIHQTSASRILAELRQVGFVRKTTGRRFTPDYGVLTLSSAVHDFDLIHKPRSVMEAAAKRNPGAMFSLGMMWRDHIIYFLRTQDGTETIDFIGSGYPLHLSTPGLRLLLELPEPEALAALRRSRERHGWDRTTPHVPATEEEALAAVRTFLSHDLLILDGWANPRNIAGAIPLATDEPVALSITTRTSATTRSDLALTLHQVRHEIQESLRA